MNKQREQWGSRLGFLLAAGGSAIGLGSLWRFPYVVGQNGGGLFVLLYIGFLFLIALPIFVAEIMMGRSVQRSPVFAFSELSKHSKNWKMAGWFNVITAFLILSFYATVSGWSLNYVVMSLSNFTAGRTPEVIATLFDTLYTSGDLNLFWTFLFMLLTVGVVYSGVQKGIEYWSKILMPLLFLFLIGLTIYSSTLEGFIPAVKYIFVPDISRLHPSGILEALGLAFFTMSVGMGIIITYGSYMKKEEDIPTTSIIVALMTSFVSIMAALMIFPIIFTFGLEPAEGPGLVFKTLPILFEKLPGTLLLSTIFFSLLVFTALTSAISLFEELVATLMELLDWSRQKSVLSMGLAIYIMSIPSSLSGSGGLFPEWAKIYGMDFFSTLSFLTSNWMLPVGGILVTLFVSWKCSFEFRREEFARGSKIQFLFGLWHFLLRYIAPIAIFFIILQQAGVINIDTLFGG